MAIDWTKLETDAEAVMLKAAEDFVAKEFGPNVSADAQALATQILAVIKSPTTMSELALVPTVLKAISDLDNSPAFAAAAASAPAAG